jgi:tetratricopeptide (TPR) repeat protein
MTALTVFCACGSGLRAARCCELATASLPTEAAARHLVPIVERAIRAQSQGATEIAEQLCIEVLELAPNRIGALSVLFEIRRAQGNVQAALVLLARLVNFDPNNAQATIQLATMLMTRGRLAEAEHHARNAVRIAPDNPQSHNVMGMIMTEANRPQTGEYHYRRVLALTGQRDPILLANLAWNLKNQGRVAEARALYAESLAAAPSIPQTLNGAAQLEEADRDFEAATALLDRFDQAAPGDPSARILRATVLGRQRRYNEALALLDQQASEGTPLGPHELLQKGRLLDQLGHYDAAWDAFTSAKAKARELSGLSYHDQEALDQINRLSGFFTAERLRTLPEASVRDDVPQPIFILGFPRSGTTLVEQTLTAHPRIAAGDELPVIMELSALMPRILGSPLAYPEALSELWMGDQDDAIEMLRDHYLYRLHRYGVPRAATLFTDKMPLNETHLGLIALLFPTAPLIHVLRHPLDVVLSTYSNALSHGFNCAASLESVARHYALIAGLVEHYRAQADLRYLAIRYEDMVRDQERVVRQITAFIGVRFDMAQLRFHENRRHAPTASYAQVTEPLYDRSVNRWHHYRGQLAPVIPILRPAIERLGYTLD